MSFPEVVPDASPEALHAGYGHPPHDWQHGEKYPKYVVPADHQSDYTAPSVQYEGGLIPVDTLHSQKHEDMGHLVTPAMARSGSREQNTICGLRRKVFWLLLGTGLFIMVVSIAGGVGGGMAAARSRKENNVVDAATSTATSPVAAANSSAGGTSTKKPAPSGTSASEDVDGHSSTDGVVDSPGVPTGSATGETTGEATGKATGKTTAKTTATTTATTTEKAGTTDTPAGKTVTTGTTVVSTTTAQPATTAPAGTTTKKTAATSTPAAPSPTATFLNNQTVSLSGFAFQAFAGTDYAGTASSVIQDEGFLNLPFSSNSYVWLPNGSGCCITFCSDDTTAVGWWCDEKRQDDASAAFPRVWIGCGSTAQKEHACS